MVKFIINTIDLFTPKIVQSKYIFRIVTGSAFKGRNRVMEGQPNLEIQLLGDFRLTLSDQFVQDVLTGRLKSLLAYLLVHRQAPVPRQRLAFMFWPDTSEKQARTNLRRLVHRLKVAFPQIEGYLLSDNGKLGWNVSAAYRLDLDKFEMAAAQASNLEELQMAIDRYPGDLLPDNYEDWVLVERERLSRIYESLLLRLAEQQEKEGHYLQAIHTVHRLQRREPLHEEYYRLLMRFHAKNGDRAGVRRVYDTCKAVMQVELGVGLDPETEAAYSTWFNLEKQISSESDYPNFRLQRKKTNLRIIHDDLIGRSQELEQVKKLVIHKRAVTLTGFGGIGKTRLALAVAAETEVDFHNGVRWIDLAPLDNPALVPQVFADVLEVREEASDSLSNRLIDFLSDKHILLVVDNCEHLIETTGRLIEQLLKDCPDLHILATSRVSLHLPGETIFFVSPLLVPDQLDTEIPENDETHQKRSFDQARNNPSIQLFVERASSALPTFRLLPANLPFIVNICRRLDGIPLAIELAAGRIRLLNPKGIATRLDRAFQLLSGGKNTLPRHQTLFATLDWSYSFLDVREQILLRRLAVFSGGFTLEDAEAVAHGEDLPMSEILEQLAGLVDHSLVANYGGDGERHFRLHEVTRQYALEKLVAAGEKDTFQANHLSYFCQLAEQSEPFLNSQEQLFWLQRLDQETGNLRVALEWGAQQYQVESLERALRLAGALWIYWSIRGRFMEGLGWIERILNSCQNLSVHPEVFGKALNTAASFAYVTGDNDKANKYAEAGRIACEQAQYIPGRVISLHVLGLVALNTRDTQSAEQHFQEGLELAQRAENPWLLSLLLQDLGLRCIVLEDYQQAHNFYMESLDYARQVGDRFRMVYALFNLGYLAIDRNEIQQAILFSQESYQYSREIGETRGLAFSLDIQATVASLQGRYADAKRLWQESLALLWESHNIQHALDVIEELAMLPGLYKNATRSVWLLAASQRLRDQLSLPNLSALLAGEVQDYLNQLRIQLGEKDFNLAWEQGEKLNIEQMVRLAGG